MSTEQIADLVSEGNSLREQLDEAIGKLNAVRAERNQARKYATSLERITTAWARGMYSAWIDCRRGDAHAAARCLSEGIDGFDGTPWNGTETGTEWWERTKTEEGLHDAPAMTGAGAEHVARQLLDPGNPGAWQRVADMPAEGR